MLSHSCSEPLRSSTIQVRSCSSTGLSCPTRRGEPRRRCWLGRCLIPADRVAASLGSVVPAPDRDTRWRAPAARHARGKWIDSRPSTRCERVRARRWQTAAWPARATAPASCRVNRGLEAANPSTLEAEVAPDLGRHAGLDEQQACRVMAALWGSSSAPALLQPAEREQGELDLLGGRRSPAAARGSETLVAW